LPGKRRSIPQRQLRLSKPFRFSSLGDRSPLASLERIFPAPGKRKIYLPIYWCSGVLVSFVRPRCVRLASALRPRFVLHPDNASNYICLLASFLRPFLGQSSALLQAWKGTT